jgi:thiol-disulfide isomerase/thioredoxin
MPTKDSLLKKILSLAAYLAIAAVIAFLIADSHPPTLAIGQKAPLDEKIVRADGHAVTFRKMLTKPMVINFWATWCPPCLKELPAFSKLSQRFKEKIIFVGATLNSDREEIAELKKHYVLTYELIAINDSFADVWQARALPTTYLVDTSGTIVWAQSGLIAEAELEKAIKAVLAKKS